MTDPKTDLRQGTTSGRRRWLVSAAVVATAALVATSAVADLARRDAEAGTILPRDTFERVVSAGGWGTASGGARWIASAGPRFQSVDGHHGVMSLPPAKFSRATLKYGATRDSDATASLRLSRLPGGSGVYVGLFSRLGAKGEYRGTLRVHKGGTVSALIYRLGTSPAIVGAERTIPGLRIVPGQIINTRLVTKGVNPTRLELTVWAWHTVRPAAQVVAEDSTLDLQNAGAVGIATSLSGTSPVPVAVRFPGYAMRSLDVTAVPTPSPVPDVPLTTTPDPTPPPTVTPTVEPTTPSAPSGGSGDTCVGTQVSAGDDVRAIVNAAPAGSTVCISAGVHRISAPLAPRAGVTVAGVGAAVLDGAVPLTGWASSGSGWYVAGVLPSSYSSNGQCEDNSTNPCLIAEQVFSDDARLRRVMSLGALAPGTFFEDFAANRVYVGSDPTKHDVVMSRTRSAIVSSAADVTVRDLTIQHFASLGQSAAVLANGPRWHLVSNVLRDNHALGALLSGSDGSVVQDNTIVGNGQLGLGQHDSQNVLVKGNTITGNNTEGFWIADWESGGFKATKSSSVFAGNTVSGNLGVGVWLDVDCKGVTVEDNVIADNAADGIRFEISYDGVIRRNKVTGNGFGMGRGGGTSIYATAGINSNSSTNVDIYGNTVSGNMNAIGLQARDRGTGLYGARLLVNNDVHGNSITMTSGSAWGQGATGLVQNMGDTSYFTSKGNSFTGNTYVVDSASAKRFAWNGTYVTGATWQSLGNDAGGSLKVG